MSNRLSRRLLFGATNRPSANAMSSSATSSRRAATRRALPTMVREVSTISEPASRMERSEWVPPPEASVALSPLTKLIASGRDAKLVGHHLAEAGLVALPARLRADDEIDRVGGRRSTLTRSCGMPTGVST